MEKKGLFITFEGPDGSGKTSVASKVVKDLEKMGYEVIHTREPGGIEISEEIRNIVLDPKNTMMDARTEALLYAASRRQHLVEKVFPALRENKIVICERFVDSSLAYQGYGREIGFNEILEINNFAIDDRYPDLTIYLDVDEEIGLDRIKNRANKDRLDVETIAFHHRVVEGYKEINRRFKDRIVSIDASRDFKSCSEDALRIVLEKLNDKRDSSR